MNSTNMMQQLTLTGHMILFGLVAMFGFAFINEMGKQTKWNHRKGNVYDFLAVLFFGIIFCVLIIYKNCGLLRNYIFLGLAIGFALYRVFLQNAGKKVCKYTVRWLLWWCKKVKRVLLAPWHLIKRCFVLRIKQKLSTIHQRYIKTAQNDDELEEII